jgi:hypothetical protein
VTTYKRFIKKSYKKHLIFTAAQHKLPVFGVFLTPKPFLGVSSL